MNLTATRAVREESVRIPCQGVWLDGNLALPQNARGIVVFAHGSGSSRLSPRNRFVAQYLQERGLATLLMDLLTREEEDEDSITREWRFDIEVLAKRLVGATDWLGQQGNSQNLPLGYFGASTGAAAALVAAANRPDTVRAVVSRGGRPDLAADSLPLVYSPTLLIVGGHDFGVIALNQQALEQIASEESRLEIVPNATHLFEEPGALEQVAYLAADWFGRWLGQESSQRAGAEGRP